MKLKINMEIEYDENFMELGDFRYLIQDAIRDKILETIMAEQKTKTFVEKKIKEVLGDF